MFKKILIANRGEIACRVIKTARRMGIATVAVYSDADRDALHVEMADEAVHIGAAPAAESYLLADRILQAIRDTGAEAVHPGYGFLSENTGFAEALAKENVAFIGPPPGAIAAMGDKIESKRLAGKADVSTVPGYVGEIADADEAVKIAAEIGYPVMIKASAGGGGKGMRIARSEEETREGFVSAANEARSSFGDDRIFIEKFVEDPRHIEIQVLADAHGTCLYLGERECSIQRRHQKVIEEAPSPFLDEATRRAMGEQAVALAQAVGYTSAGTVEFIVDSKKNFYFLEMNTRLQVEHPVTELITGIDLVEQMIRVAAGEKLAFGQQDVALTGWALEARVYAEDPYRGFLPSIGRLQRCRPPAEGDHVRVDTGVVEGSEISMFYDPMVAKLITYGDDRDSAIENMLDALDAYDVRGIAHNIPFLSALVDHPRFREGRLTTGFIAEEYPEGFAAVAPEGEVERVLMGAAALMRQRIALREASISGRLGDDPFTLDGERVITLAGTAHPVTVRATEEGCDVTHAGGTLSVESEWMPGESLFRGLVDDREVAVRVSRPAGGLHLSWRGIEAAASVRTPRAAELAALMPEKLPPDMSNYLVCPMPGLVVALNVEAGDEVEEGQPLAVVEAMKMENILRAERKGVISAVRAGVGDSLAVDDIILEFE